MSLNNKYNVYKLEKSLIPFEEWDLHRDKLPRGWWEELNDGGGPIGLAYTEETGYCILCYGQGPFIHRIECEEREKTS